MAELKLENLELKAQCDTSKSEKEKLENEFKGKIEVTNPNSFLIIIPSSFWFSIFFLWSNIQSVYQDVQAERDTFNLSKTGLDTMYIELQRKFFEETKQKAVGY